MEESSSNSRLEMELSLLDSMYPSQCEYNPKSRDLSFKHGRDSTMVIRLPILYPESGTPELISAHIHNDDSRGVVRQKISSLNLEADVEMLDAIVGAFIEIVEETVHEARPDSNAEQKGQDSEIESGSLTVVVWLHHLLATSKRKAALHPPHQISGMTKPGYPGVMVFTGPAAAIREHVTSLKGMKWQAFQIRYEENILWKLRHHGEVVEVEKLGDVVEAIVDPKQKDLFLEVMKVK